MTHLPDAAIAWGVSLDVDDEADCEGAAKTRGAGLVGVEYWGDAVNQTGGVVLVVSRTLTTVRHDCQPVDMATLEPPTDDERSALAAVLDHLGHLRLEPELLLMAAYE